MWKRLFGKRGGSEESSAEQESAVDTLDRPEDPRGGVQTEEYRNAGPDNVVQEGETAIGGPGGAPAGNVSTEERRESDRPDETG